MPTTTTQYEAQGIGRPFLAYPVLQFLTTNDYMVGTCHEGVPDGPFNRELHKLLQNDANLSNLLAGWWSRTWGISSSTAHDVGDVPLVLEGSPTTPANFAVHIVLYSDYEVTYRFDGNAGEWLEFGRTLRVTSAVSKHTAQVTIPIPNNADSIVVPLPTVDQNSNAFAFGMADLKSYYVDMLEPSSGIISILPSFSMGVASLTLSLSHAPTSGNYNAVLFFEHIAVS